MTVDRFGRITPVRFARIGYTGTRWRVWYGEDTYFSWQHRGDVREAFRLAVLVAGSGGRVSWHPAVAP